MRCNLIVIIIVNTGQGHVLVVYGVNFEAFCIFDSSMLFVSLKKMPKPSQETLQCTRSSSFVDISYGLRHQSTSMWLAISLSFVDW